MSLLDTLGIRHPIFLAPMAGVSTPQLCAEVSNHGGLGSLGLGASSVPQATQQILATQALTDEPFQVNFFCHESESLDQKIATDWINYLRPEFEKFGAQPPTELNCIYPSFLDHDDYLKLILETRPKVASFHFGIPLAHQIRAMKSAGIITMVTATNLAEALSIEERGIDIIIAQGVEAGGHRGIFKADLDSGITTQDLVQLLTKHVKIPVVAAGGIMSGQQAQQLLQLGAAAVQLGTAFVQCSSSNASSAYKTALFNQPLTQITASISGRPARGLINQWHQFIDTPSRPNIPAYPYCYDLAKQLHSIATQHQNPDYGAFWAGSNVSQIRQLEAVDLMNQIILEMQYA